MHMKLTLARTDPSREARKNAAHGVSRG